MSAVQGTTSADVGRALDRVFARPEFGEDEPTLLDEFLEWLAGLFEDRAPADPAQALDVVSVIVYVLLGIALLTLAVAIGRVLWERYRVRAAQRAGERAEIEARHERIRQLYRAALAARDDGDLRLALRMALFALVAGLGQVGDVEYRAAWTYREILRNGCPAPELAAMLARLVDELEAKEFGTAPIDAGDVERLATLCREHLTAVLGPLAAREAA